MEFLGGTGGAPRKIARCLRAPSPRASEAARDELSYSSPAPCRVRSQARRRSISPEFSHPRAARFEPLPPSIPSLAGERRDRKSPRLRHHPRKRVVEHLETYTAEMRQQVDLGQQHCLRVTEHHGVLERLVFALGDGERNDVERLPKIVDRRTDEIANVLDDEDV